MSKVPMEYSGIRQYSKDITNEPITQSWGQFFRSQDIALVTDGNLSGKRIEVDFVATTSSVAAFASYVSGSEVRVMLFRGTSGSTSGTIYVTVHDD